VDIIPVIDLMQGQVVHARRGQRDRYAPLQTPLSRDAQPNSVLDGLLALADFRTVYIADLDALMGQPPQTGLIAGLVDRYPDITFWVDNGYAEGRVSIEAWGGRVQPVLGSESIGIADLVELRQAQLDYVLSLDFREDTLIGAPRLLTQPGLWPDTVILMNLARVGSLEGPDLGQLSRFFAEHPDHRFIAAGGVRDAADLAALDRAGATAVLLASALHQQALTRETVEAYATGGRS
jgi:phosphoribosylformimino-5-aminoimidazole carboxamide ribotide isomerase